MKTTERYSKEELMERLKGDADRFNASRLAPGEYDCPECMNRGFFMGIRKGYRTLYPCKCQERQSIKRSLAASGMEKLFRSCDFTNFQEWSPWAKTMKEIALDWAKNAEGWLLLSGQSGTGKTHLGLAACGYRLGRRNQRVEFLSWREFAKNQMDSANSDRGTGMEKMKKAKLLYVDDLFKTSGGRKQILPWEVDICFELLNYRYNNRLDTVISTEYTSRELLEIDEAIASRILEMAGKHVVTVERGKDKNYRLAILGA